MQSSSFLDYQRHLDSREGRNNAESLFGLTQIPSLEQIRNILDQVAATNLFEVFDSNLSGFGAPGIPKKLRGLRVKSLGRPRRHGILQFPKHQLSLLLYPHVSERGGHVQSQSHSAGDCDPCSIRRDFVVPGVYRPSRWACEAGL